MMMTTTDGDDDGDDDDDDDDDEDDDDDDDDDDEEEEEEEDFLRCFSMFLLMVAITPIIHGSGMAIWTYFPLALLLEKCSDDARNPSGWEQKTSNCTSQISHGFAKFEKKSLG